MVAAPGHQVEDPLDVHVELGGDLLGVGLATELALEEPTGRADLVELLDDVHGQAYDAGLLGDAAGDRLAHPPGGVRRELVALGVVELLDRADQAGVALLDQVEHRHLAAAVLAGDGDDEPEVGVDEALHRALALLDDPLELLLGGELGGAALAAADAALVEQALAANRPASMVLESSTSVAASSSGVRAISSRYRPTLSRPSISRSWRVVVVVVIGDVLPSYRWAGVAGPACLPTLRRAGGFPVSVESVRPSRAVSPVQTRVPRGSCTGRHFSETSQPCSPRRRDAVPPQFPVQTGRMRVDLNADLGEGVTDDEGLLAGGHQRQPRLRLPRRRRGHDARRLHRGRRARASSSAPRSPTPTASTSAGGHLDVPAGRAHRLGLGAGGRCSPRSPRSAGRRWPTSSRTARSTTGSPTTRTRRPRCCGGAGRCRCSGCRARRSSGSRPPGATCVREGFPDRGYTDAGRLVPARPARRAGRGGRGDRAQRGRAGRRRWSRCASTATHRERSTPPSPYAGARREAGYDVRPW